MAVKQPGCPGKRTGHVSIALLRLLVVGRVSVVARAPAVLGRGLGGGSVKAHLLRSVGKHMCVVLDLVGEQRRG